jgi:hypothetical protein
VMYLWKIAYDEAYSAYAPGNVLLLRAIEHAFESPDIDEINCLTDSPWNRDWNMGHRDYFRVTVWPKRLLPFLAGYCRVRSKMVLKRVPGVRTIHRYMGRAAVGSMERRAAPVVRNPS